MDCSFKAAVGGLTVYVGSLTIELAASMEDALSVRVYRFSGAPDHRPALELRSGSLSPKVEVSRHEASIAAGHLRAVVRRDPFRLSFLHQGRELTYSLAPYHDGERLCERLHIAPGEVIRGMELPLCLSSRGYALLAAHTGPVAWDVRPAQLCFGTPGEELRYHLLAGTPQETLARFAAMTGAVPPVLPRSLLPWRGAALEVFDFSEETIQRIRERGRVCRAQGIPLRVKVSPLLSQRSQDFAEALRAGYFVRGNDGAPLWVETENGCASPVDFTSPAARDWFAEKARELARAGADALEAAEMPSLPADALYSDGSDPLAMREHYAAQFQGALSASTLFTRSTRISQRRAIAIVSGEPCYDGIAQALRRCLALAHSGVTGLGVEIPDGLAEGGAQGDWYALALLSPHPQLGSIPAIAERLAKLRSRLTPYLLSQAMGQPHLPMMRPMSVAFPGDRTCDVIDTQYMLGGDLLVAPTLEEGEIREFYLPEGTWTDLYADRAIEGGRWVKGRCPTATPPILARPGALLPFALPRAEKENPFSLSGLELRLYALADGQSAPCDIYGEDGQLAARATAAREGDTLHLSLSELITGVSFVLVGLHSASQIQGGAGAAVASGLRITPSAQEVSVLLSR